MNNRHLYLFLLLLLIFANTVLANDSVEEIPDDPQASDVWKDEKSGMEFVWMPSDCFQLGNPDKSLSRFLHEKPVHEVCLDGFWMSKYEVTNAQYRHYKGNHSSKKMKGRSLDGDKQPVVFVSWVEAKEFARWLTERHEGSYLFRLPTEAEWEYSCRAGSTAIRYWGESSDEACGYANVADEVFKAKLINLHACSDGFTVSAPVGSFKSNAAGLHDMLGNVWEWCEDRYGKDAYRNNKRNNPVYHKVESGINYRVIRGGSWLSGPDSVRCAKRSPSPPENQYDVLGFRLVVSRNNK